MRLIDHFTAIDTETTGLGPVARIVEVAVVHYVRGRRVDSWSTFVQPLGVNWEDPDVKKAMAVNQIDREQLKDAPGFSQLADKLLHEMGAAIVVAHNAEFDMRMIQNEFVFLGQEMKWRPGLVVCTKSVAMKLDGFPVDSRRSGYRLHEVAARYGVSQSGAHRALADATTCGDVLVAMCPKLPLRAKEMPAFLQ